MEAVQQTVHRKWIDQEKLSVQKFIDDWKAIGIEKELSFDDTRSIGDLLDIEPHIQESIEADLDPESLKQKFPVHECPEMPAEVELQTLLFQKNHLELCKQNKSYRMTSIKTLRHRGDKYLINGEYIESS